MCLVDCFQKDRLQYTYIVNCESLNQNAIIPSNEAGSLFRMMSGAGSRLEDGAASAGAAADGQTRSQKRSIDDAGSSSGTVLACAGTSSSAGCGDGQRGGKRQACGQAGIPVHVSSGIS